MNSVLFVLPAHWAPALVNDDYTGLGDYEKYELKDVINSLFPDGFSSVCVEDPVAQFERYHDARRYTVLPCDCIVYRFFF